MHLDRLLLLRLGGQLLGRLRLHRLVKRLLLLNGLCLDRLLLNRLLDRLLLDRLLNRLLLYGLRLHRLLQRLLLRLLNGLLNGLLLLQRLWLLLNGSCCWS